MCMYCDAKAFDERMFQLVIENEWVNERILETAMNQHAGNHNLGTIGIRGNIDRWLALSKVRRSFARKMKLDENQIGNIAYRAKYLSQITNA